MICHIASRKLRSENTARWTSHKSILDAFTRNRLLYRLGRCDCEDVVRNTVVKEPRGQEDARTWARQASPHEQLKGLCSASVAVMSSSLRRGWTLPYNLLECLTHTGQSLTKHTPTQHHFSMKLERFYTATRVWKQSQTSAIWALPTL